MNGWRWTRFSLRGLAILIAGIAIGLAISRVPAGRQRGPAPRQAYSFHFSEYRIEPPDVLRLTVTPGTGTSPILSSELPVAPDGKVNLGSYGTVLVAGCPVHEAQSRIAAAVQRTQPLAKVNVEVVAYNSKAYYLIHDLAGARNVQRCSFTGNDDVQSALSQLGPGNVLAQRHAWIERPASPSRGTQVIAIDLNAVLGGGPSAAHHPLLPGDRLFVSSKPMPVAR